MASPTRRQLAPNVDAEHPFDLGGHHLGVPTVARGRRPRGEESGKVRVCDFAVGGARARHHEPVVFKSFLEGSHVSGVAGAAFFAVALACEFGRVYRVCVVGSNGEGVAAGESSDHVVVCSSHLHGPGAAAVVVACAGVAGPYFVWFGDCEDDGIMRDVCQGGARDGADFLVVDAERTRVWAGVIWVDGDDGVGRGGGRWRHEFESFGWFLGGFLGRLGCGPRSRFKGLRTWFRSLGIWFRSLGSRFFCLSTRVRGRRLLQR